MSNDAEKRLRDWMEKNGHDGAQFNLTEALAEAVSHANALGRAEGFARAREMAAQEAQRRADEAMQLRDGANTNTPMGQATYRIAEAQWDVLAPLADDIRAMQDDGEGAPLAAALAHVRAARSIIAKACNGEDVVAERVDSHLEGVEQRLARLVRDVGAGAATWPCSRCGGTIVVTQAHLCRPDVTETARETRGETK